MNVCLIGGLRGRQLLILPWSPRVGVGIEVSGSVKWVGECGGVDSLDKYG